MAKTATLDRCWSYRRKSYGPGEDVEIPNGLYDILEGKGLLGDTGDVEETDVYGEMNVEQLKAEAKKRDIEGASSMKRGELLAALRTDDEKRESGGS